MQQKATGLGGGMSKPPSHVAGTVRQVCDRVQLVYRGTAENVSTEMQVAIGRK
jgi:hypothetical protein